MTSAIPDSTLRLRAPACSRNLPFRTEAHQISSLTTELSSLAIVMCVFDFVERSAFGGIYAEPASMQLRNEPASLTLLVPGLGAAALFACATAYRPA